MATDEVPLCNLDKSKPRNMFGVILNTFKIPYYMCMNVCSVVYGQPLLCVIVLLVLPADIMLCVAISGTGRYVKTHPIPMAHVNHCCKLA